jgi:Mechanosensitive ion channel, conserved TM helix
MRETFLQALEQAYNNFVRMVAEFLPHFLVMMIIILVGLLVAFALKYILRTVLRLTRLDRVSEQAGASRVLRLAHLPAMTELLSRSLFWVTWFGFILIGLSVLGVASLQEQISRLLRFLPEVFIAILILFLGMAIANFLSRAALLALVNAGYTSARIVSRGIRFVILTLAVTMTLEELGLARQTVISAFSIVFGATMLGLAIAFGLGGQDLARKFLEKYSDDNKREKDKEPQPM